MKCKPQRLFTMNVPGNLHQTARFINARYPTIIPGIVAMSCDPPYQYTIVVYRAEQEMKGDDRAST